MIVTMADPVPNDVPEMASTDDSIMLGRSIEISPGRATAPMTEMRRARSCDTMTLTCGSIRMRRARNSRSRMPATSAVV